MQPEKLTTALNLYMLQAIIEIGKERDVAEAMLRFGLRREEVEELIGLNPPQILGIAQSPFFLFSVDRERLGAALRDGREGTGYKAMHQQIVNISGPVKKERVRS